MVKKKRGAPKSLVFGVGVNDVDLSVSYICNGKYKADIFYSTWHSIIRRCYSEVYHIKKPTYKECEVCSEWLLFSRFKAWMIAKNYKGKQLDKDLKVWGNKKYSPENCMFVSGAVNSLFNDSRAVKGVFPTGVHLDRRRNKYTARRLVGGKRVEISGFKTPELADTAYKKLRLDAVDYVIANEEDNEVIEALKRIRFMFLDEIQKAPN